MNKAIYYLLLLAALLSFSACGNNSESSISQAESSQSYQDKAPANNDNLEKDSAEIDIDLTELSSTMVYSEVYNMMVKPEDYIGKIIKMKGQFSVYQDPATDNTYYSVIIADATACCSQGLEFVLAENYNYPDDYPEVGEELTVTGTFQTYEEDGNMYCHLIDAKMN